MKKLNTKEKIKRHIWQNGHRAKDGALMPGVFYDLLVDGKIRVCVIGFETRKLSDCDVIATVVRQKKRYCFNKEPIEWRTITKILGKKRSKNNKVIKK